MGKCCGGGTKLKTKKTRNDTRQDELRLDPIVTSTPSIVSIPVDNDLEDRREVASNLHEMIQVYYDLDSGAVDLNRVPNDRPVVPRYRAADVEFRSSPDGDQPFPYGSLYFTNGVRIRLCHSSGPELSTTQIGVRICVTREKQQFCDTCPDEPWNMVNREFRAQYLEENGGKVKHWQDFGFDAGYLLEFDSLDGTGKHISRGIPVAVPPMTQRDVNALVLAALSKSNAIMKKACSDIGLS